MNKGLRLAVKRLRLAPFALALLTAILYCIDGRMIVITPLIGIMIGRIGGGLFCNTWILTCLFPFIPFAFHIAELLGAEGARPYFCFIECFICLMGIFQGMIDYYSSKQKKESSKADPQD